MLLLGSHFCVCPAHNNIVDDNPVVQNLKKHIIGVLMVEFAGQSYGQLPLLRTAFVSNLAHLLSTPQTLNLSVATCS